jgi:hypothetical protein
LERQRVIGGQTVRLYLHELHERGVGPRIDDEDRTQADSSGLGAGEHGRGRIAGTNQSGGYLFEPRGKSARLRCLLASGWPNLLSRTGDPILHPGQIATDRDGEPIAEPVS